MISVTKRFDFCAAHYLKHHDGKCKQMHGHNYVLEVTVCREGAPDESMFIPYRGMVMDFDDIKKAVMPLIDRIDHTVLNDSIDDLPLSPTAENLAIWFFNELYHRIDKTRANVYTELYHRIDKTRANVCTHVTRVRVYETPTSWAECEHLRID